MDFSLVTDHPDYEEIVSQIVTGVDPKNIAQWLKIKYPDTTQKHLHLNLKLLQDFTNKHADLDYQLKKDLLTVKMGEAAPSDYKIAASLANNKTYMERLQQLADAKLDIKKTVNNLVFICNARMEQVFDKIQENPTNIKGDYILLKYFETLSMALERANKIVNEVPDQTIQVNIHNQVAEPIISMFQEAIRETLTHIEPEAASLFMEVFTEKLLKFKAPKTQTSLNTPEKYEAEAQLLREVIIPELTK